MGVVRAKIQTVEDIYRLIWQSVATRRPIEAIYDERRRLFCPHRLGRNRAGELRVLCYQYGGESRSGLETAGSAANWRCTVLEKFSRVRLLNGGWHTAPIIPAPHPAWSMPISTPRISQTPAIRNRDSKAVARRDSGRW